MLKRLYVDNYRCLVNFQLDFRALTLLVGPNGVGKSSVLDLLFAIRQLLSGVAKIVDPGLFPRDSLTRWQANQLQILTLTMGMDNGVDLTYRLEVEHEQETRRARIIHESLKTGQRPLFEFLMGDVQLYRDDHSTGPKYSADWSESALARVASRNDNHQLTRFLEMIRGVAICALDPKRFQTDSPTEEAVLQVSGANLASWYRSQVQEQPDRMSELFTALRQVLDGFDSMRLEKVGSEVRSLMVDLQGQKGGYVLRLDELSDGQRALMALYALIHLSGSQDILFLDEPDNYLALAEIQPWLMALSDACGTKFRQAVICSHHPELLDYLGGEAGILLDREKTGVTTTRPLREVILEQSDSGLKLSEIVARGWEL